MITDCKVNEINSSIKRNAIVKGVRKQKPTIYYLQETCFTSKWYALLVKMCIDWKVGLEKEI
jgi:hypothetical protein